MQWHDHKFVWKAMAGHRGMNGPAADTIRDRLEFGRLNPICVDVINHDMVQAALRIVVTLCLLHDNPDLIEPLPLDADKAKWEATHDIALLEKAARRGKRGWAIGRQVEVAPGFRRPHFAIRWTGKGGAVPKLRPIKGCLVRRQLIQEVPTGYLDDFETRAAAMEPQAAQV